MINCNRTRKRYILKVNVPDDVVEIEYKVYINSYSILLFDGKSKYFGGDYEIDYTDFLNNYLINLNDADFPSQYCRLLFMIYYTDSDGNTSSTSKSVEWYPDDCTIDYKDPNEIVNTRPTQIGLINYTAQGCPSVLLNTSDYPVTVAIYPLIYFTFSADWTYTDGKTGGFSNQLVCFDPNGNIKNYISVANDASAIYKFSAASDLMESLTSDTWESTFKAIFRDNVVAYCDPQYVKENIEPFYLEPKILTYNKPGVAPAVGAPPYIPLGSWWEDEEMPSVTPIFSKKYSKFTDVMDLNDFTISYTEEELDEWYEGNVKEYMDKIEGGTYTYGNFTLTNMSFTKCAYSYKVMILYNGGTYSPFSSDIGIWSAEYGKPQKATDFSGSLISIADTGFGDDCIKARLYLDNCGFLSCSKTGLKPVCSASPVKDTVQTVYAPQELIIPLKVKNGILQGKTTDTCDKTTYIDRYGNTHNSTMTNTYEIDCYIDDEWLATLTGDDINYTKIMLACQNAQNTWLCTNATISGLEGSETVIEGRIKDVTKIETYSNYSNNRKVPSYKITFQIFN